MHRNIANITNKRILIGILNWGLGHAVRCVPIIRHLINSKNEVILASDGVAMTLLQKEFPSAQILETPSYNITYSHDSMIVNIIKQARSIIKTINDEQKWVNALSAQYEIDLIISDNRLGFYHQDISCIYMTHQVTIPGPRWAMIFANKIHRAYINKYQECWIPDNKHPNSLSGKMSDGNLKTPKIFIGPQSRLLKFNDHIRYDYTAIISGPEPKRSQFEKQIIELFSSRVDLTFCIIRGSENERLYQDYRHIEVFDLLDSTNINTIINQSNIVICRSGYTSIMDMYYLGKRAFILPTKGQYEQEYLAKFLDGKHSFKSLASVKDIQL